jgi:FtsH-binding integral membrane protein
MEIWTEVWSRTLGEDELTRGKYTGLIGGWIAYGVLMMAGTTILAGRWPVLGVLGLVLAILGIMGGLNAKDWMESAIGYTELTGGMGMVVGLVNYILTYGPEGDGPSLPPDLFARALLATAFFTVIISIFGILFPFSIKGIEGILLPGLGIIICVLIGSIAGLFLKPAPAGALAVVFDLFSVARAMEISAWLGCAVFLAYIMSDWNRALKLARTPDNALDVAWSIYMDIVGLLAMVVTLTIRRNR